MNIQLIQGQFSKNDAIDLINKMFDVKIKFHEHKIINSDNEEDIKFRESKIKHLQKELYDFKNGLTGKNESISINAVIEFD